MTTLTAAEQQAKGFSRLDVARLCKKSETRVRAYVAQYVRNGNKCSADFQAAWDAECARWDHLRASLSEWPNA